MIAIERAVRITAPIEDVFSFVANYQNTPLFLANLRRFEPLDDRPYGLGSRFTWEATAMGVRIGADFEVTAFDKPYRMAARTVRGPKSWCEWSFEEVEEGTLAAIRAEYLLPNVPLVHTVGGWLIRQEMSATIERSLRSLRSIFVANQVPA